MNKFQILTKYSLYLNPSLDMNEGYNEHTASDYETAVAKAKELVNDGSGKSEFYIVEVKTKVTSKVPERFVKIEVEEIN